MSPSRMQASSAMDARLAALREEGRRVERSGSAGGERPRLPFGLRQVDERLGGRARRRRARRGGRGGGGGAPPWGGGGAPPAWPTPKAGPAGTLFLAAL